ncbi:chorismate-binding protein [Escherichia coli]
MRCECNQSDEEFGGVVRLLQKAIRAGEISGGAIFRIFFCPARHRWRPYYVLKKSNPSPYMFFMQDNDFTLFGASPESSLKYDATSRQIEILPNCRNTSTRSSCRWFTGQRPRQPASNWKCVPIIKSFLNI